MTSDSPRDGAATASAAPGFRSSVGLGGVARRTLGISMLMVTVFLWTASNFMASFMFNDYEYTKPFFVVYINTSVFAVSLIPIALKYVWIHGAAAAHQAMHELFKGLHRDVRNKVARGGGGGGAGTDSDGSAAKLLGEDDDDADDDDNDDDNGSNSSLLRRRRLRSGSSAVAGSEFGGTEDASDDEADEGPEGSMPDLEAGRASASADTQDAPPTEKLDLRATAWLSLEFCMLWFLANYFAVACLEHTSVASATIFTSLSGVFTLLLCALARVERFTLRKLIGVLASLVGVVLVSTVDLSSGGGDGDGDGNGAGQLPPKTPGEIATGDAMALLSAVVYGAYVTVMKQRVGHEDRVDMSVFFGLVGLFNVVLLWPGLVLLHVTGIEKFELPPTSHVWTIMLLNSFSSFLSDLTWAYAMLLTTPLVVTVGLSLTIPLSIVGEMFQFGHYASGTYWLGASIVVFSFLFINHESHEADEEEPLVERIE